MMRVKIPILLLAFSLINTIEAQVIPIKGYVRDITDGSALIGATVAAPDLKTGTITNSEGFFAVDFPIGDSATLEVFYVGYEPFRLRFWPKNVQIPLDIRLSAVSELEEITISSTRTNSRIEDVPVKIEVLGVEELNEEASLVPGGMGSLLGDLSVITIQRTGPQSGNDAVRMQGLAPGYTQLLQDGLPLYGGFSGSLGVLNIPPLDLRQVEIIKGSSSTLYGGGAIGGLINFLSKRPGKKPESTLLLNQTTLGETNVNAYFSRKINENQGFTLLAATTIKSARDINSDGFVEIPKGRQLLIHPQWFWGMGKRTYGDIGFSFSENRVRGGDLVAVQENKASAAHPFFLSDRTRRLSTNGQISSLISKKVTWNLRGAGSVFQRGGEYAGLVFEGQQLNTYLETNILWKRGADDYVFGTNLTGEKFSILDGTQSVPFSGFGNITNGYFAQMDHHFSEKLILQAGFRLDNNFKYGFLALPRASLLYKQGPAFSARLGYGRGYKTPDFFTAAEPSAFSRLQPIAATVRPDVANSMNMDLNWHKLYFDALSVELNQAFYYVNLARPFETVTDSSNQIFLQNTQATGNVLGTDTYIQLKYKELELYFGYNHTISERKLPEGSRLKEPFNPQDKVAATLAWALPEKWRMGVETAYMANQFVDENRRVPSFWFWAAMIARQFPWGTVVLNCENIGDARQARHEPLVTGTLQNPVFTPLWGPVEGRALNVSVKVNW